ncbi:MAG: hypothetical protein ACREJQ_08800 [bacterium]
MKGAAIAILLLSLAASCARQRPGGGAPGATVDSGKPIRLMGGIYNVRPRWNATGDTLGWLTGFQTMGLERARDLMLWKPGDPPEKVERVTEARTLDQFTFSPDGQFVSYQELLALKQRYEWGVIDLATRKMRPLFQGTENRGGGVWAANDHAVAFGGAVFSHNGGAWKQEADLKTPCPQSSAEPVGDSGFLVACIGNEDDNLFRFREGKWAPFHVDDGIPNFLKYFPESRQYVLVLVQAWKTERAQYTIYVLDKDLSPAITIQNLSHPLILSGFSNSHLYFSEKADIRYPDYDSEVIYFYPAKLRKVTKVEHLIWDVRNGIMVYSPIATDAELWARAGEGPGRKLMTVGRIGGVAVSPDAARVALSAQRNRRIPDSFIWVLNLPK